MVKVVPAEGAGSDGRTPEIWLAVETSTRVGSVAVRRNELAVELTLRIQGTHSERLLPAIDYALHTAGAAPAEVSAFIVGSGPGSFTGVRIAASLAKGWAAVNAIPLYAYPSLLGVAVGSGVQGAVCAMFDARRGEVYAACYDIQPDAADGLLEPKAWHVQQLLDELSSRGIEPAFSGEGATLNRGVIQDRFPAAQVLPDHLGLPRASNLLWLREIAPELGRVEEAQSWGPLYVREWRVTEEKGTS